MSILDKENPHQTMESIFFSSCHNIQKAKSYCNSQEKAITIIENQAQLQVNHTSQRLFKYLHVDTEYEKLFTLFIKWDCDEISAHCQ